MNETRRRILAAAGLAPLALLGVRHALAQAAPANACYDLAKLPLAQRNMRRSVGFVDPSPEGAKRCGTCAFFATTQGSCGTCQIFSGGPTAASAYCTSYAPKA